MKDHGEKSGGWSYQKRSASDVKKRAEQKGGQFDSVLRDGITSFSPKEGSHRLRILPPTWDDPRHFGMDVWVHYGVGADDQQYLCAYKMKEEPCSICEAAAQQKSDDPDAPKLKATRRVAYFVIDRKDEAAGPKCWLAPWTFDRDLSGLLMSDEQEVLEIDNPDEGYDVTFNRVGAGLQTKYSSIAVARRATPLSDEDKIQMSWLKFAVKNPIPTILNYFEAEHIDKVFNGGTASKKQEADDEPKTRSGGRTTVVTDDGDEDLEPPVRTSKKTAVVEDDDKPEEEQEEDEPPKAKKRPTGDVTYEDDDEKPAPKSKADAGKSKVAEAGKRARTIIADDDE